MFSFNLIDETWLPCVMFDGTLKDLSLRGLYANATEVRELVGDSPPVTIALHRFLLAILHRVLNAPQNCDEWNQFWKVKSWNMDGKLDRYFADWKDRFDLFDQRRPFYQVGSISENVQAGAIIQLYFQGKNNATLFEHSTTGEPKVVSPAEAARLLIAYQGFDFGGIKADGSAQTAPLLQGAIALVRGENLFETLMLNFHTYNENDAMPFKFDYSEDLPAWERDVETEAIERQTDGYVDLLTWQARRILLQPEEDAMGETIVKNAVIMRGYQFAKNYQRESQETMMAFRKSRTEGFYPIGFSENKALWRDSLSLFQTVINEKFRPKTLDRLNELVYGNYLRPSTVIPIEFYGLSADKAKLLFWQQDKFSLPLLYLDNNELLNDLETAIKFAEEIADLLKFALKGLADSLETDANGFAALSSYWSVLEIRFQRLLLSLTNDKTAAKREWFEFVDEMAKHAFNETVNGFSGSALEQKAIVESGGMFYRMRAKLLNANAIYRENLPRFKTKEV